MSEADVEEAERELRALLAKRREVQAELREVEAARKQVEEEEER